MDVEPRFSTPAPSEVTGGAPIPLASPAAASPTVAEAILDQLAEWGVRRIYGVVGDAILGLMDALARQDCIQFVAVKHEAAAALMASAEAKLTGGLGVCVATMGPGLVNLLNGLADAALDRVSVLAITGQSPTDQIGTDVKQFVDQQRLVDPLAVYTAMLASPRAVVDVLATALQEARTRRGVAHLTVPRDLFFAQAPAMGRPRPELVRGTPVVSRDGLERVLAVLRAARRPMVVAGIGARGAADAVVRLAERWGAGVVVSLGAKGAFPETSPVVLGGIGTGGNPYAGSLLAQADVVLVVGDTWWPEGYVPVAARVVQVDVEAANVGRRIPAEIGLVGDARAVVPALRDGLAEHAPDPVWVAQVREAGERWRRQNAREGETPGFPLHPARVVRAVETVLPPDAIVAVDTGDVTVWTNRSFRPRGQTFLFSGEWRTMGFALPAALAAKLCQPARTAVALVGDGGLAMAMAELLTATRHGLKVTVVVFNNGALQMERDKMVVSGLQELGVDVTNPDFVRLAEACGWRGFRVEREEDLEPVLRQALAEPAPALVDVPTASVVYPETKPVD
ncbi:pyruvate oxidase [Calditerricola satsumensis]